MRLATTTIILLTTLLWACGDRPCEDTATCQTADGGTGATSGSGGTGGTSTGTATGTPGGGGAGGGTKPLGDACVDGSECSSGFCADDVCCDAECGSGCASCAIAGSEGTCTPFDAGVNPDMVCGDTSSCNGSGECSGAHIWSRSFGGPSNDRIVGIEPVDGGYIIAGNFAQTIDFGSGPLTGQNDIFVAKLDEMGNEVWSKRFGDADVDSVEDLAVTPDGGVVVTGSFVGGLSFGSTTLTTADQAAFLAKLSGEGDEIWSIKSTTTSSSFNNAKGKRVGVDSNTGDVFFAGTYMGTLNVGGSTQPDYNTASGALFLARFSPSGQQVWTDSFGSSGGGVSNVGLVVRPDGSIVTACYYYGTLNFGGLTLNGGIALAALSSSGGHIWSNNYTSGLLWGLSGRGDGQLTMTGDFKGSASFGGPALNAANPSDHDLFVARFDSDGQHAWSISKGAASDEDRGYQISDGPMGLFLAGRFGNEVAVGGGTVTSAGAADALVLGLSEGGADVWGLGAGDAGEQEATVVAQSDTTVIVGGIFTSTVALGSGATLTSNGGNDVFVAAVAP